MPRVSQIPAASLPEPLRALTETFTSGGTLFSDQAAVLAHVPSAAQHLMQLLSELKAQRNVSPRYIEIGIVVVSRLNECTYCVDNHKPKLVVEGISAAGVDRLLDYHDHPELDALDKLVVQYAIAVTEDPLRKVNDKLFAQLREHLSEAQVVELTLRIALCGFFNRFNEALGIDGTDLLPRG